MERLYDICFIEISATAWKLLFKYYNYEARVYRFLFAYLLQNLVKYNLGDN